MGECCEDNVRCVWAVGWNMPGYMPDSEPMHFETWQEARDAYCDELLRAADEHAEGLESFGAADKDAADPEATMAELDATIAAHIALLKARTAETEASFDIGQYRYWLERM